MKGNGGKASSVLRWFPLIVGLLIAAGLAISLIADRPSSSELRYADAWREIGGAIVSGAIVAGLVLWFEERREDQRVDREERRDDEAAKLAWRREIDIRLISIVFAELDGQRSQWINEGQDDVDRLAERERRRQVDRGPLISGPLTSFGTRSVRENSGRSMRDMSYEIDSLLWFLREEDLDAAWGQWSEAWSTYIDVPRSDWAIDEHGGISVEEILDLHTRTASAEVEAWESFLSALESYRDTKYP